MRSVILALLLPLWLAGCQPLPHPFEDLDRQNNQLLILKDGVGVTVLPVIGVPTALGGRLSAAVASAFRDAGVPAAVDDSNRGSFVLAGAASLERLNANEDELVIEWDVAAPDGTIVGSYTQREPVSHGQSLGPTPQHMAQIAERGVARIVAFVRDDMPVMRRANGIVVRVVQGAPGDGAQSLKRALEVVLRQNRVPLGDPEAGDALALAGQVTVADPVKGKQMVTLKWALLMPDGTALGEVSQQNEIPAGLLDRAWGGTALLVAEAAYEGIQALLEQAPPLKP